MEDIRTENDITFFVESFYSKVQKDKLIGPIFKKQIENDRWPTHLKTMVDFWKSILLSQSGYTGNPFNHHVNLGIKKEHFERWIALFTKIITSNFEGPVADEAVARAQKIGHIFEVKLRYLENNNDA